MYTPTNEELLANLEKLAQLKDKGIITPQEFAREKHQILAKLNADAPIEPALPEATSSTDGRTNKIWYRRPLGMLAAFFVLPYFLLYFVLTRHDPKKAWFQHGGGAVVAVLFAPLFAVWHIWRGKTWHLGLKALATVFIFSILSLGAVPPPKSPDSKVLSATATQTPAPTPQDQIETQTQAIAFESQDVQDAALPDGQTRLKQTGQDGEKTIVYSVTYLSGKETARKQLSESVTKPTVAQIISHGTYIAPTPTPNRAVVEPLSGGRTGATCKDGTHSTATGSGACSHHGGVAVWLYN